jgi:TonB family protein
MKITFLLGSALISTTLFAQTTRQTTEGPNTKKVFYVLKSDNSIKEGSYAEYSHSGKGLICEGFYKNNLKDSVWKYYAFDSKLAETGYYKNGKKNGAWNTYDNKGEPEITYDYTAKKLLLLKPSAVDTTVKQYVISGKDSLQASLDQGAIYLDGTSRFWEVIYRNIRYPAAARDANVQGKVWIAFTIDTLGTVSNYRVKKGIGAGCDEEALHMVKLVEGDWLPAMLKGKPVTVEYAMFLNFTLETR